MLSTNKVLRLPLCCFCLQLHQFQLAVGETQCQDTNSTAVTPQAEAGPKLSGAKLPVFTLQGPAGTTKGGADNTTTTEFEVPAWAAGEGSGLLVGVMAMLHSCMWFH